MACGPLETSRSSMRLGGASASRTHVIGPISLSHTQGTSCTIIDSQAAIDQTIITPVTTPAPWRRHVSASSTVINGTATVTYCGPAEGIISGSAAERTRTFQKPPRPRYAIVATTAALNT